MFTMSQSVGCSPLIVNFSNTSTGFSSNSVFLWDFGNGNTSALQNPGAVFTEEKTYTVTLTVKDGSKTSSTSRTITVYKKPKAEFSPTAPGVCLPYAATFNSTSSSADGTINSYYWDFGDGITQQTASPQVSHAYSIEKKYTVSLTVTSSNGCYNVARKEDVVQVLGPMSADFTAAKTALCSLVEPLVLTNNSTGPGTLTYAWSFGDNTSSNQKDPSHLYTNKNNYTVVLRLGNEHRCVAEKRLDVNAANFKTDFDLPALACDNQNAVFTDKSTPMQGSKIWKIDAYDYYGFGNTSNLYLTGTGNHTVKLINNFGGCPDTATKILTVQPTPVLNDFIYDVKGVCGVPVTVEFKDNTATAAKWEWMVGEGYYSSPSTVFSGQQNSSFNFTQPQNVVSLKVTNTQGCSSYPIVKYLDLSNPAAGYIYPESLGSSGNYGCIGTKFRFTPRTHNGDGFTSYKWTFDDGTTSTDPIPEHAFSTPGNHTVTVEVVTIRGCTAKYSNYVTVYAKPKANFVVSSADICGNTPVTFTSTSTDNYWHQWDFGTTDLNYMSYYYSYDRTVKVQYKNAGAYTIRLIASNDGCSDTLIRTAYVNVKNSFSKIDPPVNSCDGNRDEVTFSESSVGAQTWQWDFGDGTQSAVLNSSQTIKHVYAKTGAYKVVLITTDGACTNRDSTTAYVLKKQRPVLVANKTDVCIGGYLPYTITTQDRNPYVDYWYNGYYSIKWENEDGTAWDGYNSSNPYWNSTTISGNLGAYTPQSKKIRAIIQAYPFSCSDTTDYILVNVKGSYAGFDVITENICYKSPVVLKDTSKTSSGNSINSLTWEFGDGTSQSGTPGSSVSHTYANPGYYYVNLTVRDNSGCTASSGYSRAVRVNGPKAGFTAPVTAYTGAEITFVNTTNTYNSYPNITYSWDFGDASAIGTDNNGLHAYAAKGTYTVKLTAINTTTGCSSEFSANITIIDPSKPPTPPVPPPFIINKSYLGAGTCLPLLINVTTTRTGSRIVWDFDDGTLVENQPVSSHVYTKAGTYNIKLSVYQSNSDVYEEESTITIQSPQASISANILQGCPGLPVQLSSTLQNASSYLWDFGDGSLLSSSQNNHAYQTPGIYTPSLLIKDANGCISPVNSSNSITIFAPPVVDAGVDIFISPGDATPLKPSGSNDIVKWNWSPAMYLNCSDCQYPVSTPEKRLTYTLTVTNSNGCTASDSVKIKYICGDRVSVPNSFTPNGDRKNDVFSLRAASVKHVKSMHIYNRWGQLVHHRSNYDPLDHNGDWNGYINGMQAPAGAYVYIIEFECDSGETFTKKGSFILTR